MTIKFGELATELLNAPYFATLSTVSPSGAPQSSVIWLRTDGDDIIFSTIKGRLKTRHMEANPKVSLLSYDPQDPYAYVEVRGTVTFTEEGGTELIDELSRAYTDTAWTIRPDETRLVVRLTPSKVIEHVAAQSKRH